MPTNIEEVIATFGSEPETFTELVANPAAFISSRDLDDQGATLLTAVADRSRVLAFFTPKTLSELANDVGSLPLAGQLNFDSSAADAFRDSYTDNYSDKFSDSYANSDARISVDSWTRELVLNGGLDITNIPGGGFSGL